MSRYGISGRKAVYLRHSPCAFCKSPPPSVIDHDHKTGRVRGSLCAPCNSFLGKVERDPDILARMLDWIEPYTVGDTE